MSITRDSEYRTRLYYLRKITGSTKEQIVERFLGDLLSVPGWNGGSDERMLAKEWFLRNASNFDGPRGYEEAASYLNALSAFHPIDSSAGEPAGWGCRP